jgi:hypothetical protein
MTYPHGWFPGDRMPVDQPVYRWDEGVDEVDVTVTEVAPGGRDLTRCLDRYGYISANVTLGTGPGAEAWKTGASADPATVAKFLRELADDVEKLGRLTDPIPWATCVKCGEPIPPDWTCIYSPAGFAHADCAHYRNMVEAGHIEPPEPVGDQPQGD